MSAAGPRVRPAPPERLAAWLFTGPLGHLYAFLADAAVMWVGWALRAVRRGVSARRGSAPEATP